MNIGIYVLATHTTPYQLLGGVSGHVCPAGHMTSHDGAWASPHNTHGHP